MSDDAAAGFGGEDSGIRFRMKVMEVAEPVTLFGPMLYEMNKPDAKEGDDDAIDNLD